MPKLSALAQLEDMLTPLLTTMGYDLVRLHFSGGFGGGREGEGEGGRGSRGKSRPPATLQIMAERQDRANMTVKDCSAISRAVSDMLETNDPIQAAYLLEVSSPGLDRPLVKAKDFDRFTGEVARIELSTLRDGRKKFTGVLAGLEQIDSETMILLQEGETRYSLPLALIDKARLVITDAVMARELARQQSELNRDA
ncbi:MAG: ribosome maturation factor RimP [Alphaproteobacteria bacterium]|nr:ribosome maturation factor RimP [Alphaproteobacteria bacterium]